MSIWSHEALPRQKVEWVWSEATESSEVSEVDCSLDEQDNVDDDDEDQETDEWEIVLEIFFAHKMRNFVLKFFKHCFLRGGFWRHKPLAYETFLPQ